MGILPEKKKPRRSFVVPTCDVNEFLGIATGTLASGDCAGDVSVTETDEDEKTWGGGGSLKRRKNDFKQIRAHTHTHTQCVHVCFRFSFSNPTITLIKFTNFHCAQRYRRSVVARYKLILATVRLYYYI